MSDWLTDDVVQQICSYMNREQPDSVLQIVRLHADIHAEAATLVGFDHENVMFITPGGREIQIPWPQPLTHRGQIREELVSLSMLA